MPQAHTKMRNLLLLPMSAVVACQAPADAAPPATSLVYAYGPGIEWRVTGAPPTVWRSGDGGGAWTSVRIDTLVQPTMARLVFFGERGWLSLVGRDAGALFRTTDGGKVWSKIGEAPLLLVGFVDAETGWAATPPGGPREVRVTHDGGASWAATALPTGELEGIWPPAPIGLAVFRESGVSVCYATEDGGVTWTRTSPAPVTGNVVVAGPREVYVSRDAIGHRTVDGGRTWAPYSRD